MQNQDPTETMRRLMVAGINASESTREDLEKAFGKGNVFDTAELRSEFNVISFLAPFVLVRRKSDETEGTLVFQDRPRFYFDFIPT